MAADYDRLFQPSDGAEASDAAGTDFDIDGPPPMPPTPPMLSNLPKPNGQAAPPPMPVEWAPPNRPERPPMPVDYHRPVGAGEVTAAPDEANVFPDYDTDGPPPMPPSRPMLPNVPKPNGKPTPPPMPIDWTPPSQPESPPNRPESPVTPTESPPAAPCARSPVPPEHPRHARHSRPGPGDAPDPQPVQHAKSQHSHRAASPNGNGKAAGPSVLLGPPARTADGAPAETRRRPEPVAVQADPTPIIQRAPVTKPVSRRGWRRRVHTLTRINVGLSRDEKYEFELQNRIRRTVRGSYEIGVLGLKGGVGKTAVTAAVGSTFAQLRGDRILAVDANPVSGNLADRVGRQTTATIADLMANRALSHYNDVRAHTSINAVALEVLSAAEYNGARPRLGAEDWKRAIAMVPRYYNLVLADCGGDLVGPAARGVLAAASGLVIMSSATADGARQAAIALDWLRNNGFHDLLNRACVVVNHVAPRTSKKAADDVVRKFQECAPPGRVIVLPWDEHIAAGTEIHIDQLSAAYRRRITELAAALSDDFDRGERR
jgi:MinD-like ATPase involved in chromosome partitioning or flagellar assembly